MKALSFILLFMVTTTQVLASSIGSFHYSGQLLDDSGNPMTGPVDLRFRLYENTTLRCQQSINNVPLNHGVFNVDLSFPNTGAPEYCDSPANSLEEVVLTALRDDNPLYIEVIETGTPITYPQQALSPVFFSAVAKYLKQKGASDKQYLKWNATTRSWEPGVEMDRSGCSDRDVLFYNGSFFDCESIDSDFFEDDSVNTFTIADKSITNPKLAVAIIDTIKISDETITGAKFATGVFDISDVTTGSGENLVSTDMIQDNSITNPKFANDAITHSKIAEESLNNANFAPNSVDNSVIADQIYNNQIQNNTLITDNFDNSNIENRMFQNQAVTNDKFQNTTLETTKFVDESVTTVKIANEAITNDKVDNLQVINEKIIPESITSTSIQAQAITTDKITDLNVTTEKMDDEIITNTKLAGMLSDCQKGDLISTNADGSFSCETNFVSGMIRPWNGPVADIPQGWQVCDGTNSTPNLMDRYIYGASVDGELLNTGGSLTHVHNITWSDAHDHTFSATEAGHQHIVNITGGSHSHVVSSNHTHSYGGGTVWSGYDIYGASGVSPNFRDYGGGNIQHRQEYAWSGGNTDDPNTLNTQDSEITLGGTTGTEQLSTAQPVDTATANTNADTDPSSSEPEFIKFYFICYP